MRIPTSVKSIIDENQTVTVATADQAGHPHLAAARGIHLLDEERVIFENWFCMQTLKNIEENPEIALALPAPQGEEGFQLLGVVEEVLSTEMLNGMVPEEEKEPSRLPQVKHSLRIKVEKILQLSTGPHSDESS